MCWARVPVSVWQHIGLETQDKLYDRVSECGKGGRVCGPQPCRQIWPSLREVLAQMEELLKALLEHARAALRGFRVCFRSAGWQTYLLMSRCLHGSGRSLCGWAFRFCGRDVKLARDLLSPDMVR